MIRVVIPFCRKDSAQMANLIRWAIELDGSVPFNAILSYETGVDPAEIRALARQYFQGDILENEYSPPPVPGWPAACNWAWQSCARFIDDKKVNEPWFWWESDAVPLKPGWLTTIHDAFIAGGKRFGGHIVDRMGHMNGVGIYPPDVRKRCYEAMMCRSAAWDVVLKTTTEGDITDLNHLIQHVWNIRETDGAITNGDGHVVTFPDWPSVEKWMDFNCVLLHRTKDGTLIQRLRERRAQIKEEERLRQEEDNRKAMSVELNVPNFTANSIEMPRQEIKIGPVEWFIVTYAKDAEWFSYAIRCIKKFCTGFQGVTVAVPNRDKHLFKALMLQHNFRLYGYDEVQGKGFVQHEAIMGMADTIVPKKTEFVIHLDSDCMYHTPTTPEDYFIDGKPVYLIRTYESLVDDKGVISDCAQWRGPTAQQLGFDPIVYSMCRHPTVLPIGFYKLYRDHIENVHKKSFMEYFLEGKNEFPSNRMDWTAMGAFAYQQMPDAFHWIDIGKNPAPKDRQAAFWSHSGVKPEHREKIEGFLK
jgi:hypothetical protein